MHIQIHGCKGRAHLAWMLAVALTALGTGSCGPTDTASGTEVQDSVASGTLAIPLVAQANGVCYRLVHAVFAIRGVIETSVGTDALPDETSLTTVLPVGQYEIAPVPGWQLERQTASGWVAVDARVVSSVQTFFIVAGGTAQVVFRFQTDNALVDMGTGNVAIGITVEVVAPPAQRAVKVGVGQTHTCAVFETGAVRCWGDGSAGQLGYGNTQSLSKEEATRDVDVGGPARELALGTRHTCALLQNGSVRCWGQGGGALGYGNTASIGDDEAPSTAGDVQVGGPVQHLVAGASHTCALLVGGSVRCWGEAFFGELGYGNQNVIGDNETPASAGDVPVGAVVLKLAAKVDQTCAVLDTGTVRCWGFNYTYGEQIGDNEPASAAPALVYDAPVGDVAAGGDHLCALIKLGSGTIVCNGSGHGHLNPDYLGTGSFGSPVQSVVTGRDHSCALTGEEGSVRCWGIAERLGAPVGPAISVPISQAVTVPLGKPAVDLAAGLDSTCAVLDDGTVHCW